jgi:hypothetical protein
MASTVVKLRSHRYQTVGKIGGKSVSLDTWVLKKQPPLAASK